MNPLIITGLISAGMGAIVGGIGGYTAGGGVKGIGDGIKYAVIGVAAIYAASKLKLIK